MSSPESRLHYLPRQYRLGDFILDRERGLITRGAESTTLRAKTLQVLCYLIERQGRLVSKRELIDAVWPDCAVTDNSLAQCIAEVRRALGHDSQQLIQTVAKRGYIFTAPATHCGAIPVGSAQNSPEQAAGSRALRSNPDRHLEWKWIEGVVAVTAFVLSAVSIRQLSPPSANAPNSYEQLTSFTDSAVAPTLSPDGRMVAFLRSDHAFLTTDQIYVKLLPRGEPIQVTHDPRPKYNVSFSPDGSRIAYTVLESGATAWNTYTVSSLGGSSRRLLSNAAGLIWLDGHRLLFSAVDAGVHMGIVTATENQSDYRPIYFPQHDRAMVHYSFPSPDRKWALVVQMDPDWQPCRLVHLGRNSQPPRVGPEGSCTAAGWSIDGRWMYFAATVNGNSHLWRQHFPAGVPQQITFGPSEESGLAMAPDGRSLITSIGLEQSSLWIHDSRGEHALSSEGYVSYDVESNPSFSSNGKHLYYLLRQRSPDSPSELWRTDLLSGENALVLPGISMREYDVSNDEEQVVFRTQRSGEQSKLWIARLDRSSAPRCIASLGMAAPRFGPNKEVLFRFTDGHSNYLAKMNADGSGRAKVVPYPIITLETISPDRRWAIAITRATTNADEPRALIPEVAVPTLGGQARAICPGPCAVTWSPDKKWLYVTVVPASRTDTGKTVALPILPGQSLPNLPAGGIGSVEEALALPGARLIERGGIIPGLDLETYAYVKTIVHRNLFRIPFTS